MAIADTGDAVAVAAAAGMYTQYSIWLMFQRLRVPAFDARAML